MTRPRPPSVLGTGGRYRYMVPSHTPLSRLHIKAGSSQASQPSQPKPDLPAPIHTTKDQDSTLLAQPEHNPSPSSQTDSAAANNCILPIRPSFRPRCLCHERPLTIRRDVLQELRPASPARSTDLPLATTVSLIATAPSAPEQAASHLKALASTCLPTVAFSRQPALRVPAPGEQSNLATISTTHPSFVPLCPI